MGLYGVDASTARWTYHDSPGLRIIVQDLFTKSWERRRHDQLIVVELVVFLLIFLPAGWIMFGDFLESLS